MFSRNGVKIEESNPAVASIFCCSEIFKVYANDIGVVLRFTTVKGDMSGCWVVQHIQPSARRVEVFSAASVKPRVSLTGIGLGMTFCMMSVRFRLHSVERVLT